jgi:hypothetical protein
MKNVCGSRPDRLRCTVTMPDPPPARCPTSVPPPRHCPVAAHRAPPAQPGSYFGEGTATGRRRTRYPSRPQTTCLSRGYFGTRRWTSTPTRNQAHRAPSAQSGLLRSGNAQRARYEPTAHHRLSRGTTSEKERAAGHRLQCETKPAAHHPFSRVYFGEGTRSWTSPPTRYQVSW